MGEVLGLGISHYPPLLVRDEDMAGLLRNYTLADPDIPAEAKDPAGWPERMRAEWGDDQGRSAAGEHRAQLVAGFERCRQALDDFNPDLVVMWGDDQYENFLEDVIPPYAVLALDDIEVRPYADDQVQNTLKGRENAWGEPPDTAFLIRGDREAAKQLASALLEDGIDVAYAYERLHHNGLPHAFLNAVLYLDYHRKGFEYPVVPFSINCYGRYVIGRRGGLSRFAEKPPLDPPSPRPDRLMAVGAATARFFARSPWRVALMASSSWSHAFLVDKTYRLRPDTEADRRLYRALVDGDMDAWRHITTAEIEDSGQQELLNWHALVGAMEELDLPLQWSTMVETDVFNSNKVFAVYGG